MRAIFMTAFGLLATFATSVAQFATPVVDGLIATNEYGIHANGANRQQSGSVVWYATWDANNIYFGISGSDTQEGAVVYLDVNPIAPINGGTNTDGSMTGQSYDNTNFAALPFRADRVLYAKDGYREIRSANAGGWSSATTGIGNYASTSNVREFSIPWSSLGGRPAGFAWFGYITTASGSVYGPMPLENPGAGIGTSARYERYYMVSNTNDGVATWPFARNSFVFNRTVDWTDVGNMNVYDFTMNSPNRTITRASSNGILRLSGSLRVDAGTLSFGGSSGNATIDGSVIVGPSGTLSLSTNSGGDLIVKGNLSVAGNFNANGRTTTFEGSTTQLVNGAVAFSNLTVANSGGDVVLNNDVSVSNTLTLLSGHLRLVGSANLNVSASGNITGFSTLSHVKTTGTGSLRRDAVGATPTDFPVGTSTAFNPVTIANGGTADQFAVSAQATFDPPAPINPNRAVNRQWTISEGTPGGSNAAVTLQWNASDQGSLFSLSSSVYVLQYNGSQWTLTPAIVGGSGPYTATATNLTQFNRFGVGNGGATDVTESEGAPTEFALAQNYPNPFNPSTEIRFNVAQSDRATLEVYNAIGQHVATLFDGLAETGRFYSVKFDATEFSSGTFFYRLKSGSNIEIKKMMLAK